MAEYCFVYKYSNFNLKQNKGRLQYMVHHNQHFESLNNTDTYTKTQLLKKYSTYNT
jgi:hypothetical protein